METAQKYSQKREAIFRALCDSAEHPSAEQIYARLKPEYPDLSLATVYRNLNQFCESGAAVRIGTVQGQERFDARTQEHPHFVCSECGAVIDVFLPEEAAQVSAAEAITAGRIDTWRLTFYGCCRACLEKHQL